MIPCHLRPPVSVIFLIASLVLVVGCTRVPAESDVSTPSLDAPIDAFFAIDGAFVSDDVMNAARNGAVGIERAMNRCGDSATLSAEQCLLGAILGNARLTTRPGTAQPIDSTVSSTLAHKSGTCAALVAIVLSLTEARGAPFHAVVLRDHVLLESSRHSGVFYETLQSGLRVNLELSRREAEVVVRAGLAEYVAYYLDNLAARLALAGDLETAERLFQQALESAPDSARIHYNYGMFQRLFGSAESAARLVDRAYELGWPQDREGPPKTLSLLD